MGRASEECGRYFEQPDGSGRKFFFGLLPIVPIPGRTRERRGDGIISVKGNP